MSRCSPFAPNGIRVPAIPPWLPRTRFQFQCWRERCPRLYSSRNILKEERGSRQEPHAR